MHNRNKKQSPHSGDCFNRVKSEYNLSLNVAYKLVDGHSYLLHGVAVTDGYAAVGFGTIKQKYPRRKAGVHP